MSESKPLRGENTRQEILDAAYGLFTHQGFHGTSMRQIATQAGIALGSLYNHFSSKEAVFEGVFLAYHPYRDVLPMMLEVDGEDAEERVRGAFWLMMKTLKERPEFFNLMFIEFVEFKSAHLNELFARMFPVGLHVASHLFNDPSQLRPELPLAIVMRSFLGLFFGYYLSELAFGQHAPVEFIDQAPEHMLNIFLRGVLMD